MHAGSPSATATRPTPSGLSKTHKRYVVVLKRGRAGDIAEFTDPR
jgi:hypothetical protein